jgi:2-succinyl-5-enolpyruvyl-6-hydroxy-3-cyclohexene-1-carboxylate synthase
VGGLAPNQALAVHVVSRLRAAGVRTFCLCPGGRNAPLVEALLGAVEGAEVLDFFEERSAAFFALGRARRDAVPAAVVTTSGTACAELLPAMVEAYYSCIPLIAVTADRPRRYRGTAAPQAIEQPGIFGMYARQSFDLEEAGGDWRIGPIDGPSHVNVCFDEPLLGGWQPGASSPVDGRSPTFAAPGPDAPPAAPRPTALAAPETGRPLVILGSLQDPADREDALEFCRRTGAPVLAEAASGLKPRLGDLLLRAGEAAARRGFEEHVFDSVIRIGDIPSFRVWRDLELGWRVPVVSAGRRPWPGLTHAVHVQAPAGARLSSFLPVAGEFPAGARRALVAFDREAEAHAECLLAEYPASEPGIVRRLSRSIPEDSFVYLGNSQPIREWNQFAAIEDRRFAYGENRGANGIDGQLSSFLGQASIARENWAVVGDLTTLYDLAAPWALRHAEGRVRIVVLNNRGGRIFERMFANPRFQNRHALAFDAFAALWQCPYRRLDEGGEGLLATRWDAEAGIVEVRPDEAQTAAFWNALRAGTRK